MDPSGFQHVYDQYSLLTFGNTERTASNAELVLAMSNSTNTMMPPISTPAHQTSAARSTMAPPLQPTQPPAHSEGESSFNDSGYFSSPQTLQFTGLNSRPHSASSSSGHMVAGYGHSPRAHSSGVINPVAAPRPNWQEDLPSFSDEWDNNFINSFDDHLFNFDAADMNNFVDGLLGESSKSPSGSPFKSPRQTRSATQGLGLSPSSPLSKSNVMLTATRNSPGRMGASPFKTLFSTPSPTKGLSPHTRISPMTRQRRRILQSPGTSEGLFDLPDILGNTNKEDQNDDLGVMPFQRSNSLGFTPTEELSASVPFASLYEENAVQVSQVSPKACADSSSPPSATALHTLQEIKNVMQHRPPKRAKVESHYNLRSSPAKTELLGYKQLPPRRSPARLAQGRISVTRHTHLMDSLDSKDALRFVRARFKEVLEKATANAVNREKHIQSKLKASAKKQQNYAEISQTLAQPSAGSSNASQTSASVPCYTRIQAHRPAGRRQQEILPKPTPDWPQKQPCKIAPKKRKR